MDTTVSLEFFSETKEHLRMLEQQLKHAHDVSVDMLEPKDLKAPALVAIGIKGSGALACNVARKRPNHAYMHHS